MTTLNSFLAGAICMGYLVAALFFCRFWKSTKDRLFLFFAAAFVALMIEGVIRGIAVTGTEWVPLVYCFRLGAFTLLLIAIIDKNRRN